MYLNALGDEKLEDQIEDGKVELHFTRAQISRSKRNGHQR